MHLPKLLKLLMKLQKKKDITMWNVSKRKDDVGGRKQDD